MQRSGDNLCEFSPFIFVWALGSNSGYQAVCQVLSPAEPFHWPRLSSETYTEIRIHYGRVGDCKSEVGCKDRLLIIMILEYQFPCSPPGPGVNGGLHMGICNGTTPPHEGD